MLRNSQFSENQKKWFLVGGLLTVLGFSTSFHQYKTPAEGIVILSSTSGDMVHEEDEEIPVPGMNEEENADAPARPAASTKPKATTAPKTASIPRSNTSTNSNSNSNSDKSKGIAVIGESRLAVELYKNENNVMMKVKLGKEQMEALGMPCMGDNCSGELSTSIATLSESSANNLLDIKDYSDAMKQALAQSALVKGRSSTETEKSSSEDEEEITSETSSDSAKKLAAIETQCLKQSSDYSQLTCRMQKLKELLRSKSNNINKEEALAYYQENIEGALKDQFISLAMGDYVNNPTELKTTYADYATKSRQLLNEMRSMQALIASDYSEIRESLTTLSVRIMASMAMKATEYASSAKTAQAAGNFNEATSSLQALALQKDLLTGVSSGLYKASSDGLNAAVQSDIISRTYANNMSLTVKDYGTNLLNYYSELGKLSTSSSIGLFDTQLSALDSFDYQTGRPTTIMINGKVFQEVVTTPSTTTPSTTTTPTTVPGINPQTTTPGIVQPTTLTPQMQQVRGVLGRGTGAGSNLQVPSTPVVPFTGM